MKNKGGKNEMKKCKRLMCFVLAVLMILSINVPAFALETQENGNSAKDDGNPFTIEVSTNKSEYSTLGVAKIDVTITNTSSEEIQNVSAEAVFKQLAPAGRKSETKKEVDTLKAGESISFSYKSTINKEEYKLNFFEKVFLWLVRLFNGGFTASDNGFDDGREHVEKKDTINFGKLSADNIVKVWYGDTKKSVDALTSSEKELSTSENISIVYFYAQPNELLSDILLLKCIENPNWSINLLDNGNREETGDMEAGDGIYTGKVEIECTSETTYHFYATNDSLITNTVNVDVIAPFTDKELDDMEIVDSAIEEIKSSDRYKNSDENEKISQIKNKLQELETEGLIIKGSIRYNSEDKSFIFVYSCWISGGIDINPQYFDPTFSKVDFNRNVNNEISTSRNYKITKSNSLKKAFISFGFDDYKSDKSIYNDFRKTFNENWYKKGLSTDISVDTSVEKYKTAFLNNDLIGIAEHGESITIFDMLGWKNEFLGLSTEKIYTICIRENPTRETDKLYSGDLKKGRIYKRNNTYYIAPEFFTHYYSGKLNGSIVFMCNCMGFGEGQVVDYNFSFAFSEYCGVDTVIGFHNSVFIGYSSSLMCSLGIGLLDGKSIEECMNEDLKKFGYNDIEWIRKGQTDEEMGNTPSPNYNNMTLKEEVEYRESNSLKGTPIYSGYLDKKWNYKAYKLSGMVQGNKTTSPISNVNVSAIIPGSGSTTPVATTTTDESGNFTLHLPNGTYALIFTHDNYEDYGYHVIVNGSDVTLSEPILLMNKNTNIPSTAVEFNGHYYQVYDESMTWTEAKKYCESLGGHLATITSQEEQQFIESQLVNGQKSCYWLGGTDSAVEGKWNWVTGEEFSYTKWGADMPDNWQDEDYLMIYKDPHPSHTGNTFGFWNDLKENGTCQGTSYFRKEIFGFICEWDEFIPQTPKTVTALGNCGANNGDNLKWILYDDGELVISGKGEMFNNAYPDNYSWYNYRKKVKTITIEDEVTSIGYGAFIGFTSLTSINIGNGVTSIIRPFNECTSLINVTVDKNNKNYYSSPDGVLFNKDKTELISYPSGKKETSYIIPNGVMSIGIYALSNCTSLANVKIPDTVTSIGYGAFSRSSLLTYVTIPDSVTVIGELAFSSCSSLSSITIKNRKCSIYDRTNTISETATIYGYLNSTTHAYAEKYNRKFVALD